MGLLVGDALGVPYEFSAPSRVPPISEIEFVPPSSFGRPAHAVPPGTWSDDGAQSLCLLASILERNQLDLADFAAKLLAWFHRGAYTPDHLIFDCGIQTSSALRALVDGEPPETAGPSDEEQNGNGSLMRVLPLALWHTGTDDELYADARRQSLVTHGHLRSQLCCAMYCLWARELLRGAGDGWEIASEKFLRCSESDVQAAQEAEFILEPAHKCSAAGSGYVLNTLWSARIVLQHNSYENVVRAAIALGNDTDTTACVAGGLAGIRDGFPAIPERWRDRLRGRDVYQPLLERLLLATAAGEAS